MSMKCWACMPIIKIGLNLSDIRYRVCQVNDFHGVIVKRIPDQQVLKRAVFCVSVNTAFADIDLTIGFKVD